MGKTIDVLVQEDESKATREFHDAHSKGRVKQQLESRVKQKWDSFDEWDTDPIETFQKFNKRNRR